MWRNTGEEEARSARNRSLPLPGAPVKRQAAKKFMEEREGKKTTRDHQKTGELIIRPQDLHGTDLARNP